MASCPVNNRERTATTAERVVSVADGSPVAIQLCSELRTMLPRDADVPDRIGHYAITRKLGAGAMGVVYAARDERLERIVALKTMASVARDDTARKRFWREARAAASVNHPNVCQIYEIGEDRGELFIAMELLEGEALADRLRQGAMTVSQAVPLGLEMLAALAHCTAAASSTGTSSHPMSS